MKKEKDEVKWIQTPYKTRADPEPDEMTQGLAQLAVACGVEP